MRRVRLCILVLGLLVGREIAEAAEPAGRFSLQSGPPGGAGRPERRTIGRLAFIDPKGGRRVPIKAYGTAGILHTTQARARFERATPSPDGTVGEAVVEGGTGTWSFAGAGAEIGFAGVPGLAVGSELLFALGGEGWGPGIRFAVRYYVW